MKTIACIVRGEHRFLRNHGGVKARCGAVAEQARQGFRGTLQAALKAAASPSRSPSIAVITALKEECPGGLQTLGDRQQKRGPALVPRSPG